MVVIVAKQKIKNMIITLAKIKTDGPPKKIPDRKTCNTCGRTKGKKSFSKAPTNHDGLHHTCNACNVEIAKEKKKPTAEYAKEFFVHDKYYC